MKTNNPTINHPSYFLSVKLSQIGFNIETDFTWENDGFFLYTINTSDKKRLLSDRYTPKPTWNEVLKFMLEHYKIFPNIECSITDLNGIMFFYKFEYKGKLYHGRNTELHLVYESFFTEIIKHL